MEDFDKRMSDLCAELNTALEDADTDGMEHFQFEHVTTGFGNSVLFAGLPVYDSENCVSDPDHIDQVRKEILLNLKAVIDFFTDAHKVLTKDTDHGTQQ